MANEDVSVYNNCALHSS